MKPQGVTYFLAVTLPQLQVTVTYQLSVWGGDDFPHVQTKTAV